MRTFAIVVALGAAGITLHGCGGGGDSPTPAPPPSCTNDQVDFVTQSVKGDVNDGALTLDLKIEGGPPALKPIFEKPITSKMTGDFTLKFDLEKFQASLKTNNRITVNAAGLDVPVDILGQVVFDASKQLLVLYADADVSFLGQKKKLKNCTALTIPEVPSIKNLTQEFNELKQGLQSVFSCGGNDGTNDKWQSPPIPASISEMLDASAALWMDKDYLWSEIDLALTKLEIDQKIPLPPQPEPIGSITIDSIKANADLSVKMSKAEKGGPAPADLDYSTWDIECPPQILPGAKSFKDLTSVVVNHLVQARAQGVVAALAAAVGEKAKLVTV
jgi:hypothetical protein